MTSLYPDRAPLPLSDWRRKGLFGRPRLPFVLVGHRGAAGLAPENTLPAFKLAHELGADAIELDVHLSHDGVPVVIHDDTVDRTTNGHGLVGELTVAELTKLEASGSDGNPSSPVHIPTLDDVLAWAKGRIRVVIELKGPENSELIRRTITSIRTHGLGDRVLLISFDHLAIGQARFQHGLLPGGILYANRPTDPVAMALAVGADVLCPHWREATSELVEAAHAARLAVSVWTANDATAIGAAMSAGVDAITTDFPDRVLAIASPDR